MLQGGFAPLPRILHSKVVVFFNVDCAQVSLVISLYLVAGTTQATTGPSVVLGGVPKETIKTLTADTKALTHVVARPDTV